MLHAIPQSSSCSPCLLSTAPRIIVVHAPCTLLCRAVQSARASGPQHTAVRAVRVARYSQLQHGTCTLLYHAHTITNSLHIIVSPHPHIRPLCSCQHAACTCASARAPPCRCLCRRLSKKKSRCVEVLERNGHKIRAATAVCNGGYPAVVLRSARSAQVA
jgi:hypothetical protein